MKTTAQLHWDYFLLLEKDLISIGENIELDKSNYNAYGPRLIQLILSTGGELDAALKSFAFAICPEHPAATGDRPNMANYKDMLVRYAHEQFSTARVKILRTEIVLTPWSMLRSDADHSISWWKSYNNIKHKRAKHYQSANLGVALELISALFVVDAYMLEVSCSQHSGYTQIIDWDSHVRMSSSKTF